MGEEGLDYTSEYDQLKVGTYAMAHPELAKEWTTYVAIQKGGTYSFYSKINKKHLNGWTFNALNGIRYKR